MDFIKNPPLDGNTLYYAGNHTSFLLIHGLTASTTEVRLLADRLHRDGFTVSAPLLPGHLTSPKDLNKCKWQDWYTTVESAFLALQNKGERIIVGGESMGALLSLILASRHKDIAGLLCYSPAISIHKLWMAHFLNPFVEYIPKPVKEDFLPWKGYTVNPVHALSELHHLQLQTRRVIKKITTPIAIFQSQNDHTVDPRGAEYLLHAISSPAKELHWFDESSHVMLIDKQFDDIYEVTLNFIARLPQPAGES